MRRTFIAYCSKGINRRVLRNDLENVQSALKEAGVEAYCTTLDNGVNREAYPSNRHFLFEHAFPIIRRCDFLFAVQFNENIGENMLMEVGHCIGNGIPVLLATTQCIPIRLWDTANKVWPCLTLDEIIRRIEETNFDNLFPTRGF